MDVLIKAGRYVVAVSGGVDSMVLLDILQQLPGVQLVVAHFDHGIRETTESSADRRFVQDIAKMYGLPFVYEEGKLGTGASEATARAARYDFLRRVQKDQQAQAIITAHHQDDLIETAIINMLRGTGRKGLSALSSNDEMIRPLLRVSKQEILEYTRQKGIQWREDSTNKDERYLRNYVRMNILPRFNSHNRERLLGIIEHANQINTEIDELLERVIDNQYGQSGLRRSWFTMLPYKVSCEVMAALLRRYRISFDKPMIEHLVVAAKVALPGKVVDIDAAHLLKVEKAYLGLKER